MLQKVKTFYSYCTIEKVILFSSTYSKLNKKMEFESLHRVVTIGETSVGKTSIITQLVKKSFNPNEKSTVGAMFVVYDQKLDDSNTSIEMQIWDTAGQERFRSLGPIYYRGAEAAIVVFDFTSLSSFERIQSWISAFQDNAGSETIIYVFGNKIDLEDEAQISREEAKRWVTERGFSFYATSALTGEGIEEAFKDLGNAIYANSKKKLIPITDVDIGDSNDKQTKEKGCC